MYIRAKMQGTKIVHNAKSEYFSSPTLPNARIANSFLMLQINFQEEIQNCLFLPASLSSVFSSSFLHFSMTKWPKSENILTMEQQHMSCIYLMAMMLNINTFHSPPFSQLLQKIQFQPLLSVLQSHVTLTLCRHHFCQNVWMLYFHPWLTR